MHREFRVEKTSKMFGAEVDVYGCAPPPIALSRALRDLLKNSAIGLRAYDRIP